MAKGRKTVDIPTRDVILMNSTDPTNHGTEIMSAIQLKESEVAKIKTPGTLKALKELGMELAPLNVKDLQDTATYEKIKAIDLKVVKLRTGLDKIHEEVKAPYLDITKAIDAAKREMLSEITNVETISKARRRVWEDLAAAEEARQAQIIINRTNARISALAALGATLSIDDLTHMSDALFNEHLTLLTKQAEEKKLADEAEAIKAMELKVAEEKLASEAAIKLAKDQEVLVQTQVRIAKEAEELKAAKLEMIIQSAPPGFTSLGGNRLSFKEHPIYVDLSLPINVIKQSLLDHAEDIKAALLKESKAKDPHTLLDQELKEIYKQVLLLNVNYNIPMTQPESKQLSDEVKSKIENLKTGTLHRTYQLSKPITA